MDQQRASQGPDGSYDLKESLDFMYKALSKELYIGNVYLRVYNDQPEFEISEPETFCVALVDFISYLVRNPSAADSVVLEKPNLSVSSGETSDHPNDVTGGLDNGQNPDESSESAGHLAEKEEFELVKNLKFALTSLQVCLLSYIYRPFSEALL